MGPSSITRLAQVSHRGGQQCTAVSPPVVWYHIKRSKARRDDFEVRTFGEMHATRKQAVATSRG